MSPLVSVIIPTYNYAHFIGQAISSVLNQTYPKDRLQIIVLDDGSTDSTTDVVKSYVDNGKIQYYKQQNQGKANATKNALRYCTGKYVFNLDADDFFVPSKIKSFVEMFESDPEIVHIGSIARLLFEESGEMVDENVPVEFLDKPVLGKELLKKFYQNNVLFGGGSTYCAKTSVLKSIEIPDDVDMYVDEFLLIAVLPHGKSYLFSVPFSIWRVHNTNYSVGKISKEKQSIKVNRMIKSSSAVLGYLQRNGFDKDLINIYRLQDATRKISFKESIDEKKAKDILKYASEVFFSIRPPSHLIAKYHVLKRLIPMPLFKMMKRVRAAF
jgi:glycosyltransferase involved in cell wall biosynthesis